MAYSPTEAVQHKRTVSFGNKVSLLRALFVTNLFVWLIILPCSRMSSTVN